MIGFKWNLTVFLIISNVIYVISESSVNNATSDPRSVNQISSNSLKLKNVNYAKYLSIENNSAIVKPDINPDAEQIFLPLNGHNYHPEKVLERLSTGPAIAVYDNEKQFDFLNFEPYIVKPLNVEYSQIFSHLQAKVQNKRNREAQELSKESQQSIVTLKKPGLHIDTSSYHGKYSMARDAIDNFCYRFFIPFLQNLFQMNMNFIMRPKTMSTRITCRI